MSNTPYRWVIRGIKRRIDRDGTDALYRNNGANSKLTEQRQGRQKEGKGHRTRRRLLTTKRENQYSHTTWEMEGQKTQYSMTFAAMFKYAKVKIR